MKIDAYHPVCGLCKSFLWTRNAKGWYKEQPHAEVAESSDSNGLNVALARDMVDKKSVAYAKQTFSENV